MYSSDYSFYRSLANGLGVFTTIVAVVVLIAVLAALWKLFAKADVPSWYAIVPILDSYCLHAIAGCPWVFLVSILAAVGARLLISVPLIAVILAIVCLICHIVFCYKLSDAFGMGVGFTVGLLLLYPIFIMILGFGSAEYMTSGTSYTSPGQTSSMLTWKCSCGTVNGNSRTHCESCGNVNPAKHF